METWIAAATGYLVGSLPLGFLIARRAGVDLRSVGSGNVGATNAYRAAGPRLGLAVLAVDVLKGLAAVLVARVSAPGDLTAAAVAGVAAIVGHAYPVWLRSEGGKGVAVAAGVFAVLTPLATGAAAAVFGLVVWATGFVSLGSVLAGTTLSIVAFLRSGATAESLAAIGTAALIVFRHRGNLARLLAGREPRLGDRSADRSS